MQLAHPHRGWENEHLATFLLSRIAFVSSPIKVGDDVGTDIICTLFESAIHKGKPMLLPRSSLAVQLKSNRKAVSLARTMDYLERLELPFYLGVVDQKALSLELFSARFLPVVLSLHGPKARIRLKPIDTFRRQYRPIGKTGIVTLLCHKVATLSGHDDAIATSAAARAISEDAAAALQAIVSRRNREYIFEIPGGQLEVVAGTGSAQTFRASFYKRLAEAYYNFSQLIDAGHAAPAAEMDAYEDILDRLASLGPLPKYVLQIRRGLQERRRRKGQYKV